MLLLSCSLLTSPSHVACLRCWMLGAAATITASDFTSNQPWCGWDDVISFIPSGPRLPRSAACGARSPGPCPSASSWSPCSATNRWGCCCQIPCQRHHSGRTESTQCPIHEYKGAGQGAAKTVVKTLRKSMVVQCFQSQMLSFSGCMLRSQHDPQ